MADEMYTKLQRRLQLQQQRLAADFADNGRRIVQLD